VLGLQNRRSVQILADIMLFVFSPEEVLDLLSWFTGVVLTIASFPAVIAISVTRLTLTFSPRNPNGGN
jgi:hypothetical protein